MRVVITILITLIVLFLLGRHLGIIDNDHKRSISFYHLGIIFYGITLLAFFIIPFAYPHMFYLLHPFVYFLITCSISCLLAYIILYKFCDISQGFVSFICFYVNYLILCLYLLSFATLVKGLKNSIYLQDISYFSQYRYLLFVVVGFFIASLFLVNFLTPVVNSHFKRLLSLVAYPYLYEETLKILSTWEASFWGPLFDAIITKINISKAFRYVFFITHALLSFIIPLIFALLFLYIVFVHGDLRYLIYIMPASFIAWFYRHLAYYFFAFFDTNSRAIREYLEITLLGKNISGDPDIVSYNPEDICFTLSEKAFSDFGPEYNHNELLKGFQKDFVHLGQCQIYILKYQKKTSYISYLIFGIRYLAWMKLSIFFFYLQDNILAVYILSRCLPNMAFTRSYVTKAYYVDKKARSVLEVATKGAYHGSHPVTTDVDLANAQGDVPFKHQPTHGDGPSNNPSKILSNQVDLQGNLRPQKAVYPDPVLGPIYFSKNALGNEVAGSEAFYKRSDVQANDKANTE